MNPADPNPQEEKDPISPTPATPPPPTIPVSSTISTVNPPIATVVPSGPEEHKAGGGNKKAVLFGVAALILTLGVIGTALGLSQRNQAQRTGATNQTQLSCKAIRVYDESWNDKTTSLSTIAAGQTIRIVAEGSGDQNLYSAARFSVNGSSPTESLLRKPTTNEFYYEYQIPLSGVVDFNIEAEVRAASGGQWY